MFASCNGNSGTSFHCTSANGSRSRSSANGTTPAPLQKHHGPRSAQCNQLRMEQRKKLQRQELGLSDYDPLPSYETLASELEGLCETGHLDKAFNVLSRIERLGLIPTYGIYWSLLSSCKKKKSLHYATQLRFRMNSLILDPGNALLANLLISTLIACRALDMALQVFQSLPHKDSFSWTVLITGYVACGYGLKALKLYKLMQKEGVEPNEHTCVSVIKACTLTLDVEMGKAIHDYVQEKGYISNAFVGTTLITMLGRFNSIVDAEAVFGMMPYRSIVAWVTLSVVYVEHGQGMKALQLYRRMREECLAVNEQAFAVALQACCILATKEKGIRTDAEDGLHKVGSLEICQGLHTDIRRKGLDTNIYVGNLLVCVYGKCGDLSAAEDVFAGFSHKNVTLWNVMFAAYMERNKADRTLQLYRLMLEEGQKPDERSFVIALQACSLLAEREEAIFLEGSWIKGKSLKIGEALHTDIVKNEFDSNLYITSALLNMYGRCGDLVKGRELFDGLSRRSIVSWNAMLSVYVEQGYVDHALQLYKQMQAQSIGKDDITLLCLLQISGQTGSIELCRQTYHDLIYGGFDARPLVAFNLIYAFGKCARMADAQAVFDGLPLSNVVPWNALIAGYAQEGDPKSSLYYFQRMRQVGVKPDAETFVSLLAAFSYNGIIKGVKIFDSMSTEHGVTPQVEHHVFIMNLLGYAGDFEKIEDMLLKLPVLQSSLSLWLCVLEACVKHENVKLAERAFESAVRLQPKDASAYMLMSNVYRGARLYDLANHVEISRQKEGAALRRKEVSWVEHENGLLSFSAGNHESPQQQGVLEFLWELMDDLKNEANFSELEYLLNDLASEDTMRFPCSHSQLLAVGFALVNQPSVRKPIQIKKNACICQDCHKLIKLVSSVKHSSIILIEHRRVHCFEDGKCSCHDYL